MTNRARNNAQAWMENITDMMTRFLIASDQDDHDEVMEEISSSVLSVEVSSGWTSAGSDLVPSEYRILLTFGGPSLEIQGSLNDHREVISAKLLYSDMGMEPTSLFLSEKEEEDLLRFASMFFPI